MNLARNNKAGMDFEFQRKFMDISTGYREVMEEDPRLLCQASWETVNYINDHLPENLAWNNEDGYLIDRSNNKYEDNEKVDFYGTTFAICPEAYEELDKLLPAAVKYGLKKVFGHARRLK